MFETGQFVFLGIVFFAGAGGFPGIFHPQEATAAVFVMLWAVASRPRPTETFSRPRRMKRLKPVLRLIRAKAVSTSSPRRVLSLTPSPAPGRRAAALQGGVPPDAFDLAGWATTLLEIAVPAGAALIKTPFARVAANLKRRLGLTAPAFCPSG